MNTQKPMSQNIVIFLALLLTPLVALNATDS
jgi:hypothetical protein